MLSDSLLFIGVRLPLSKTTTITHLLERAVSRTGMGVRLLCLLPLTKFLSTVDQKYFFQRLFTAILSFWGSCF